MAGVRKAWLLVLLALTTFAGACGSSSSSGAAPGGASTASGSITVLGAASLTEAFTDEKATLATEQPGLTVTYSFGGSGALVTQVQQGAPADVVATADTVSMQQLVDASLVEAPETFATNSLEILVAPNNPKGIQGLSDLARSDLVVVLGDTAVPFGTYAAQALQNAGITVRPKSLEPDVKSAVAKVTTGEADATIVYATDVQAAGAKGVGVVIPASQNVLATYPIAIIKASKAHAAAQAFIDAIVGGSGQAALRARGFEEP